MMSVQASPSAATSPSVIGERRREPQPGRAGVVEQEAALLRPRHHGGSGLLGELGAQQQPAALHIGDLVDRGEDRPELVAASDRGLQQALLLDRVHHGQCGCARDRVAAEGGAVVARLQQGRRGTESDRRSDRDSPAEPLGQGDDVGDDAGLGVREPGAGAADAGLHLVDPEQRAVPGRDLPGGGEEPGGRDDHPGLALQRLDDHGGGGVVDRCGQGVRVAVGDERDVARQRLERLAVGGLRGERQRPHGAAVERTLHRHQPGPAGAAGQLQGSLVGLGAGVGEEHPPVGVDKAQQPLRQLHLLRAGEEVRDVPEGAQLRGHRLDQGRVGVAEGVDGDAAEEVDVLPTVLVPDVGTLAAHQRQPRRAEGVHQRARRSAPCIRQS